MMIPDKAQRHSVEGEVDADGSMFVCVSDDDSIGSASDLKARINEDEEPEYVDREDASETISSSVYHAECESVTTHEDDPRIGDVSDPAQLMKRGPKPSRAAIRARAKALQEQENKKCTQDRLLGHEYGEKPLLLDDELDSETEDKDSEDDQQEPNSEASSDVGSVLYVPRSFGKNNESQVMKESLPEDVFSMAPFKKPYRKISSKRSLPSCSQPSSNAVSPLEINPMEISTPPIANSSPASLHLGSPEIIESIQSTDAVRIPVRADVIYEESPSEEYHIYENVTLNSGKPVTEDLDINAVYNQYDNINLTNPDLDNVITSSVMKNPFINPFLNNENPADMQPLVSGDSPMSISFIEPSPVIPNSGNLMSQSLDSLPQSSSTGPILSYSTTDLFGSTPFDDVTRSTTVSTNDTLDQNNVATTIPNINGMINQPVGSSYLSSILDPPNSLNFTGVTSTPRANKSHRSSKEKLHNVADNDADLFGAVPFRPILGHAQKPFSTGVKSQTLPANMSSAFQVQMKLMAKDEEQSNKIFKVPKSTRRSTPPGFRKPRRTHQILSGSESSSESEEVPSRKNKSRDRSKDRLKYKNLADKYEEENTMVLPIKQFSLKKDKQSKKSKKLEKQEKKLEKHDKKLEKLDKKLEKQDKKSDKSDKKSDKADKKLDKQDKSLNYESVGISNMSFEDFAMEDGSQNNNNAGDVLQSPEEDDTDLRMTGGTRFGSLKRGINPFAKLGR